jgi:protein TonB
MRTLSLGLRDFGEDLSLEGARGATGASASVVLHGLGIAALILVPLLRSTSPPETANPFAETLIQPLTVVLPPPPMTRARSPRTSSEPRTKNAFTPTRAEAVTPLPASLGDPLDPEGGSPVALGQGDLGPGTSIGGDCAPGAICGQAPLTLADPAPPGPPRVGGIIKEPRLIENRAPRYPLLAQSAGVSGLVVVEAHIGENGRVREARIVQGHTLFDDAALASVRSRRYEPLLLNGVPSDFLVTITIRFSLRR